jgi:uncharacterized protein YndB with AHSA1/START domain
MMSVRSEISPTEPTIVMSRIYDAPRSLVWEAMTEPRHVRQWWGGAGVSNPVCEMDVRPGGRWEHVMRFPDGRELHMSFIFLEVEEPARLVWQSADHRQKKEGGPPSSTIAVTLEDLGSRTAWKMVTTFRSMAERDAAVSIGFRAPIESSSDRLVEYLKTF